MPEAPDTEFSLHEHNDTHILVHTKSEALGHHSDIFVPNGEYFVTNDITHATSGVAYVNRKYAAKVLVLLVMLVERVN